MISRQGPFAYWRAASTCAVALLMSDVAVPQEASTAGLEEIVVTARKQQESILKVPVVETVLTQEFLEKYQTQDLYAVATRVPGFVIGTAILSGGPQVSMRGIGTTANNATIEQSVSLNIDGLQLSQGLAYGLGMFDIGQVEVLKGPQALFYGKNSPAGVISLRSADPTDKVELVVRGGYESYAEEKVGDVIASGPVADSLRLRLAVRFSDQDGFFYNDAVGIPGLGGRTPADRDVAPLEKWIVRGTALFNPSDIYNARLKLNYGRDALTGNAGALQLAFCPDGTGPVPPVNIPFITGDTCKLDKTIGTAWYDLAAFPGIRNGGVPFARIEQKFGTLEQNIIVSDALTLTSVTGLYDMTQSALFAGGTSRAAISIATDNDFDIRDFTQELRLTSDYPGLVNFMVGGFYQDGLQKNRVHLRGNTAIGLPATLQSVRHEIDISSVSLFGQVIWDVTPTLEIAPGVRWTDEERTHTELNYNPGNGPLGPVLLPDPKLKSNNVSPEVSVTYTPTDDLTVFGSYRTGFKSGSFTTIQFVSSTTLSSFGDEEVKGGEMGVKARLLDRRLAVNLAGYYYEYSGLQVGANEQSSSGVFAIRTINAASASVRGVELDATYAPPPIEGLTLSAAVNFNRARYGSFKNAPCGNGQTISEGCNQLLNPATGRFTSQDLSGRRLVRAPEWTGNLSFDYETPVGQDMALGVGVSGSYSSSYSTTLVDQPGFGQGAYTKTNANIALRGPNEAWEVALIGSNLANKITTGQCYNSNTQNGVVFGGLISGGPTKGPAGSDEGLCVAERGREVWLRLTVRPREFRK